MSWTPPTLETKRLKLASSGETPRSFLPNNLDACSLLGVPSNWTIYLKPSREAIGSIGFVRWDSISRLGELGFILKHTERRRGLMSEACQAVIDFGFHFMSMTIIEGRVRPENIASIRLLEKLGLKREERVQARLSAKGILIDLDIYRIRALSSDLK